MRSYSRQSYLLNQDVVKVAVKVEEMPSPDRFSASSAWAVAGITIAAYYLLQLLQLLQVF